jgi:5-methylcytosine-specific restriction protein A
MPKKRLSRELWYVVRERVWKRDGGKCVRCKEKLRLDVCHIDHVVSGKRGTNEMSNLRTLCRRCHVLRADFRHRGMIASAIRDGVIPFDWRSLVWED